MAENSEPGDRVTAVSLQADLVEQAEAHGLDVRELAERALRRARAAQRDTSWAERNREAIESSNRWVEENGLPLDKYRMF